MKISFSGIYDIRYPYGTKSQDIQKEYIELKDYVNEKFNQNGNFNIITVDLKDNFNTQKTHKKLADKGIRIATSFDNPYTLSNIFNFMDRKRNKNLVQQYIDNSKVELVIDTQV